MSAPDYEQYLSNDGKSPTLAGDPHDDDAQYVEQLFEQNATPLDYSDLVTELVSRITTKPTAPGRLLTRTISVGSDQTAAKILVFPADPTRTHLSVQVEADVYDYIMLADEANKLEYDTGDNVGTSEALRIYGEQAFNGAHGPIWTFYGHTGAVWIRPAKVSSIARIMLSATSEAL